MTSGVGIILLSVCFPELFKINSAKDAYVADLMKFPMGFSIGIWSSCMLFRIGNWNLCLTLWM